MSKSLSIQVQEWQKRKDEFHAKQQEQHNSIDELKQKYFSGETDAILKNSELILQKSEYPFPFKKEIDIEYNPNNKILVIDYRLPSPEDLPSLKEVVYTISTNEIREKYISKTQLKNQYEGTIYSITLRCINELFLTDVINAFDVISFNGWVKAINLSTGNEENSCILSIQIQKEKFQKINLANVDSKSCFRSLKGVSSSSLVGLTSIQPILQIQNNDKRFVSSQNIEFDNSTNLALMDWEDFEHLIRELFEKEFSSNGGEVKVTQASRDGGVDAVAFAPDPIRGGKIVIQAKRYTNTVGVSSVRDLYGTVMNEGANKGILVTTSDYGPDSYEFAKGKPITLLNGANLLYLLEKHGTRARIDIREAKRIIGELKF